MTPEQGYDLAKFQRPGVVIVMGAEQATERRIAPIGYHESRAIYDKPGPSDMLEYNLGFNVSLWARSLGSMFATVSGRTPTKAEWEWLNGPRSSLNDACKWINAARNAKETK